MEKKLILPLVILIFCCTSTCFGVQERPIGYVSKEEQCVCEGNVSDDETSFAGIVHCTGNSTSHLVVPECVTVDYRNKTNIVAGSCLHVYSHHSSVKHFLDHTTILPSSKSDLTEWMCGRSNRTGTLCGMCDNNSVININSVYLDCVHHKKCKLSAMTIVPLQISLLTILFLIVVLLQPKVASPYYRLYILSAQMICLPVNLVYLRNQLGHLLSEYLGGSFHKMDHILMKLLEALYYVWSVDIPNLLPHVVCGSSITRTQEVLALQYLKALYPSLLIVLLYFFSELHAHNFKPLVVLWRPVNTYVNRLRRFCNPDGSKADVFASLCLVSYTKIASTSVYLLLPQPLYDHAGSTVRLVLLFDGSVDYLSSEHLPFAFLAVIMLLVFCIPPIVLLITFQFQAAQRCLSTCRLNRPSLVAFARSFQLHYKDGTDGTGDHRYFGGVDFITWIIVVLLRSLAELYVIASVLMSIWFCAIAFATLTIQPYKTRSHNLAAGLAYFYFLIPIILALYAQASLVIQSGMQFATAIILVYILFLLPNAFGTSVFVLHLVKLRRLHHSSRRQHSSGRINSAGVTTDLHIEIRREDMLDPMPDRVLRPEDYERAQLSPSVVYS